MNTVPHRMTCVFIYRGDNPYFSRELDTTGCVTGRLYVHNQTTDQIVEITDQTVISYTETQNALYYLTDSQTIYKTDYVGSFHSSLYQCTTGSIDDLSAYRDVLTFIENGSTVVFLDGNTGTAEVVFAYADLDWIFVLSDSQLLVAVLNGEYHIYDLTQKQITNTVSEMAANDLITQAVLTASGVSDISTYATTASSASAPVAATIENDVTFPLSEYDARIYLSSDYYNYSYPTPVSWFHEGNVEGCGSGICKTYAGNGECEGFCQICSRFVFTYCGQFVDGLNMGNFSPS